MARNWIVRGDPTSSGGSVISGSPFTDIDGIAVARITDQATCPAHKGVFPIVEGDATLVVDGQPVALHGSALACGCKVLSAQQMHVFVDTGGGATSTPSDVLALAQKMDISPEKEVLRVFWTYGPEQTPLADVSRFYVDLNVHAETKNYSPGESVEIQIEVKNEEGVASTINAKAKVDVEGKATAMNVFANRDVVLFANE